MATLEDIVGDVTTVLRLQAGIGVNTFTETRIAKIINNLHEHLFRKRFWDDFNTDETYTMDTTTGRISAGSVNSTFARFTDIQYIWRDDETYPLPRPPANINPSRLQTPCVVPFNSDLTKMFQVYPIDCAETVKVRGRVFPGVLDNTDEVRFDNLLLQYGALYQYATELGTNQGAAELYSRQFDDRLKEMFGDENYHEIHANMSSPEIETEWT